MARWQDYILRGIRADQPSGSLVTTGTLYCVTDEDDIVERWSGSAWEAYSPSASSGGDVVGPGVSVDNDVVLFNGTTGKLIKDSGILASTLAIIPVNLATQVTGDLPYANLTPATNASRLLGRGSSGAGDWQEITLGANMSMTGTVLDSTGGSGGSVVRSTNGFRLTLASGQPVFAPQQATPSSTDTTNEIVTFAADPGWYDGTIVTPAATAGGLTTGTRYFVHRISATTYSFHTTVAAAMSGASRVDLTASIGLLYASGISTTGIYLTPYLSNQIALYDGYDWVYVDHAEFSVGLGTLSANTNYDLFLDYNGGTPNFYIGAAWTSDTVRSVALVQQDGVWVSSADAQSRYIGTFRTDSTTTTIDDAGYIASQVGGKRFLWNAYNRVPLWSAVRDNTSSWNYSTATWRQADGAAGNQVEYVCGLLGDSIDVRLDLDVSKSANSAENSSSIGLDSTTVPSVAASISILTGAVNSSLVHQGSFMRMMPSIGYHFITWMERGSGTVTSTWYGYDAASNARLSGLSMISQG